MSIIQVCHGNFLLSRNSWDEPPRAGLNGTDFLDCLEAWKEGGWLPAFQTIQMAFESFDLAVLLGIREQSSSVALKRKTIEHVMLALGSCVRNSAMSRKIF
jgi:hypothetical protein